MSTNDKRIPLSHVEVVKQSSNFLRGTVEQSLADPLTGAISEDDTILTKFHGTYQQDDRDVRNERARQKLEPAYSFMVRARITGGVLNPWQWLQLDQLARDHANDAIRVTTRQTFQFHGVLKGELKATIRRINDMLLTTLATCGDVNRNVMCTPLAESSAVHAAACAVADDLSRHLMPATRAYHELWLDGERVGPEGDEEPLYGPTYLPRKFKIAMAIPPWNDVDVFAHDVGFIALEQDGQLSGFNVTAGGGMGASHGDATTYPRLGTVLGRCRVDQAVAVAEQIVRIQRDHGNRNERKHARLKYTIDAHGVDWFKAELETRLGFALGPAAPFSFAHNGDRFGWQQDPEGLWHLGLFIPGGRIIDHGSRRLLTGLRELAKVHGGDFRFTPNQNVIVARVAEADKAAVEQLVAKHGLDAGETLRPFERDAMACVAFPTCGLAMAEAERYLPAFLEQVGRLLEQYGLGDEPVNLRITGCPNGCARPYLAEIALVGKAPGRYNLMLGGSRLGNRLNTLHRENLGEAQILEVLDALFARFAAERQPDESFGDYLVRTEPALDSAAQKQK
ncbi:MAG: assimilatory sulfite reductase (NADPH) hemoprotein subunit [Pseudomonadales bacterium]